LQKQIQSLLQAPTQSAKSYNARSGEIYGILQQMQESFEGNLADAQKEEAEASARFDELVATKNEQISKAEDRIKAKTAELAASNEAIAQAKRDLKDTRESLSADELFLVDLRAACGNGEKEYNERTASRNEELVGLGEALSILTDDSSRDLFSSSLGFTQIAQKKATNEARAKAVRLLEQAAAKTKNSAIAALAISAKLDAFTKVQAAIDDMITQLTKDQKDEAIHKDWCEDELHANAMQHKDKTFEVEDLTSLMNTLADKIETLDGDIKTLQDTVAENKVQVKRGSENRAAANKEFQSVVADQRGTIVVLNKVLERLEEVYAPKKLAEKKAAAATAAEQKAFLQVKGHQAPLASSAQAAGVAPPPKTMGGARKQNENAGGVLGLIEMTMDDAKRLEQETLAGEQDQQIEYEKFIKDMAKAIQDDSKSINDKTATKADAEMEKATTETSLESANNEVADLEAYKVNVQSSCDYVMKNFSIRQEGRASEIQSLTDAKAILSGADFA